MFPCPICVLDHTLPVPPGELFDVVEEFVTPHLSDPPRPLGPGPVHYTLTGVEWGPEHRTIDVNARLCVPRLDERYHLQEADAWEIEHVQEIKWDDLTTNVLVSVQATPAGDEQVQARIVAHPGTEAEQIAVRLAAHIVRETACTAYADHAELVAAQNAAAEKWVEWLDARITRLMAEKEAEEKAFVFPVERQITLRSLSTTVDIFIEELWKHLHRFPPEDVPTGDGHISLRPHYAPGHPEPIESPSLYVFARHHTVKDGAEVAPPTIIGPVIFVKAYRRGTERIDVVVTCLHRTLEGYLERLVGMIRDWHPEARVDGEPGRSEAAEEKGTGTAGGIAQFRTLVEEACRKSTLQSAPAARQSMGHPVRAQAQPLAAKGAGSGSLPPVTDPTNQRILQWVTEDPDLIDLAIAKRLGISRQAVNVRRNKLKAMGYKVR